MVAVDGREAPLTVVDDGVGFDPVTTGDRAAATDSFGLRATAERVEQFGGRLTVDSTPGRGTTITAVLKVP